MRKSLIVVLLLLFSVSYAESNQGFYVGLGGSYALENFNEDEMGINENTGANIDFDNATGINVKVGYQLTDLFALEFDFNKLSSFDGSDTVTYSGYPLTLDAKIDITTYMLVAKFTPALNLKSAKPFIVAGYGIMEGDMDVDGSLLGIPISESDSESDQAVKAGIGIDFFVNENVSIGIEGDYVVGLGDLDNIKYTNLSLGAAYHF